MLFDVKKGLEQLTLLCSQFQLSLMPPSSTAQTAIDEDNNNTATSASAVSLELTVQRELESNRMKIDGMLSQVRKLYHQWSSAELYYLRSLQRLGLHPDSKTINSSQSPTHNVMALAAIALSAECDTASNSKADVESIHKQENCNSKPETISSENRRTLQDIENIIIQQAAASAATAAAGTTQQTKLSDSRYESAESSNSDDDDDLDEDCSSSPACIWHSKHNANPAEANIVDAAEILLEYTSLSTVQAKMNARIDAAPASTPATSTASLSNTSVLNLTPISQRGSLIRESMSSCGSDPAYLADIQFPPTPATPPTSSNSSCSTVTGGPLPLKCSSATLAPATTSSSSNSAKYHHRRKSRYARRIATPTSQLDYQSSKELNGNAYQVSSPSMASSVASSATSLPPGSSAAAIAAAALQDRHSPAAAVAAVTAMQERALSDMFKAQFDALTSAAGAGAGSRNGGIIGAGTGPVGASSEGVLNENCDGLSTMPMSDAPYDLSIGNRLNKM